MSKLKQYPPLLTPKQHEEFLKIIQKDYGESIFTKTPFEEPKQYDIGFIPTIELLRLGFQQMPSNWPGDTYTHDLKFVNPKMEEVSLGKLTFTKLDGQWVYFGPTKYK